MENKIIIASEIYPPETGGPASFVKRILPCLKENGFEVKVITYADQDSREVDLIKIKRVPNLLFRYWSYFRALLLLAKDVDLIFAQGPTASGLPAILVKKLKHKKVIIKVVGDTAWERAFNQKKVQDGIDNFQKKKYSFSIEFQKWLRSFTVKRADLVITPSEYLKKIVVGWGVDSDKVWVIYNSFESAPKIIDKNEAKRKLNLDGFIIFSAGRLAPWKGFDTLIKLMPKLLTLRPDVKLLIAGSGPEKEKLEILNYKLKIKDSIIFAGQVRQEDMPNYYSASDLFILNSGYEGLSHTLLEALSYGLPVLASNVGGNPELVQDKVNGRLFTYNNEAEILAVIREYLQLSPDDLMGIKTHAQASVERFSFEIMIKKYLELLTK